ncbi:hypothetical protein AVDCRST_MAG92-5062 [uncultured Coleofasciculus sp.]|uniref:Uncharacterized protein n=1 Tax=uncultured Coleofasciculus sp. TaxID=1267456 RepID=A0A6J4KBS5_9CYAN|nr:hypothetical protein AVDCRST_MAG92-5062 [uncultured Coleofasciculus sp.]
MLLARELIPWLIVRLMQDFNSTQPTRLLAFVKQYNERLVTDSPFIIQHEIT